MYIKIALNAFRTTVGSSSFHLALLVVDVLLLLQPIIDPPLWAHVNSDHIMIIWLNAFTHLFSYLTIVF
jgi:hypothetical protein